MSKIEWDIHDYLNERFALESKHRKSMAMAFAGILTVSGIGLWQLIENTVKNAVAVIRVRTQYLLILELSLF